MGFCAPTTKLRPSFSGLAHEYRGRYIGEAVELSFRVQKSPYVLEGGADSQHLRLAGTVRLTVCEESLILRNVGAAITLSITQRTPILKLWMHGKEKKSKLNDWCLVDEPTVLLRGVHHLPFSGSLQESLSLTLDISVLKTSYTLEAIATWTQHDQKFAPLKCVKHAQDVLVLSEPILSQLPPYISRRFEAAGIGIELCLDSMHVDQTNRLPIVFNGLVQNPRHTQYCFRIFERYHLRRRKIIALVRYGVGLCAGNYRYYSKKWVKSRNEEW